MDTSLKWFGLMSGVLDETDLDEEDIVDNQIAALNRYIYSRVTWYDYDDVFRALMVAVDGAIAGTRKRWKPSSDNALYRREMDAMSKFTKGSVQTVQCRNSCKASMLL